MKWSKDEEMFLLENYALKNKEILISRLNRKWDAIRSKYNDLTKIHTINLSNNDIYLNSNETIFKKCIICNEFHPMNEDYYFRGRKFKDGYDNCCKKCRGKKITNKICNVGYRICKKCGRELQLNRIYFPKFANEKDFRWVCRECGKDGHFMSEGYIYSKNWTKNEEEKFKNLYPYYTNEELIKLFYPDKSFKSLSDKAYLLGIKKDKNTKERACKEQGKKVSEKLKGRIFTDEHRKKISETRKKLYKEGSLTSLWVGRIVSEEERVKARLRVQGRWSGKNNPQYGKDRRGSKNTNWKGGITPFYYYLRKSIEDWKLKSMEQCDNRCVLSGSWFDEIHHLIPFRNIVNEVLEELNFTENKEVNDYSDEEINKIEQLLKEKHELYGLGVCLNKDIHKLFHKLYGYKNVNHEMFEEFKTKYTNGELDKDLDERLCSEKSKIRFKNNIKSINV